MSLNKLNKFFGLKASEKLSFFEALSLLCFSKIVILIIPLRKAAPYFGKLNRQSRNDINEKERKLSGQVRSSIYRAATVLPWKSVCLDRALAAAIMLNKRNIPNALCLGIKKDLVKGKLEAHAWIECGSEILLGGKRSLLFTKIASFSRSLRTN